MHGGHFHYAPGVSACCLNTGVLCDPTAPFRSTVNVLRAVQPDGHCYPYHYAHWQQVRKGSLSVTILWPMGVQLEPSWRLVVLDQERRPADGKVPAQPGLVNGSRHRRDAGFLLPWTMSSTMAADGTEAVVDAAAVVADVATTEDVAVDPIVGGADAQLLVVDTRLNFESNWSAPKIYSSLEIINKKGLFDRNRLKGHSECVYLFVTEGAIFLSSNYD